MSSSRPLPETDAIELRNRLASGALAAVELADACIARIEAREKEVGAWAWFDAAYARREAEKLDALRESGEPLGPLHGLPVGIKDIIDTAGIPTENGCAIDAGRVPTTDAAVVKSLRAAGALIMGKTVTTELAYLHPNKTRNPRNLLHTPGGSSSGSAAAVADGMVALSVGTQTGGSVIRPASFCGITGFKPSFGAIPRQGVLMQSHSLDTVGVFARDPLGAALAADVLIAAGSQVAGTSSGLFGEIQVEVTDEPEFAIVHPPGWESADAALVCAFDGFCSALGDLVTEVKLPAILEDTAAQRARINHAEMAYHYRRYRENGEDCLGSETRKALSDGMRLSATEYIAALAHKEALCSAIAPLLETFTAILCPAAPGPAPAGLGSTGDAIFNGLWTMAGTPAITLPLLTSPDGLPMGIQLVGRPGNDDGLLQSALWLWRRCRGSAPEIYASRLEESAE